jgi:hypothetical protein
VNSDSNGVTTSTATVNSTSQYDENEDDDISGIHFSGFCFFTVIAIKLTSIF